MKDISIEYIKQLKERYKLNRLRSELFGFYEFNSISDVSENFPVLKFEDPRMIYGFCDFSSRLTRINNFYRLEDLSGVIEADISSYPEFERSGNFVFSDFCKNNNWRLYRENNRITIVEINPEEDGTKDTNIPRPNGIWIPRTCIEKIILATAG